MDKPVPRYPSPRPTLSFEEWFNFWLHAESCFDSFEDMDHFEARATYAECSLWVFQEPKRWLVDRLTLTEVGTFLANVPRGFGDERLPLPLRLELLRAIRFVYTEVFEPFAGHALCHLGEHSENRTVAITCFMLWDACAFPDPRFALIFRELCHEFLGSKSAAVQESALHGLGHHLSITSDAKAAALIEEFLVDGLAVREELNAYARDAKIGHVL
jgi:hypothetical protein